MYIHSCRTHSHAKFNQMKKENKHETCALPPSSRGDVLISYLSSFGKIRQGFYPLMAKVCIGVDVFLL